MSSTIRVSLRRSVLVLQVSLLRYDLCKFQRHSHYQVDQRCEYVLLLAHSAVRPAVLLEEYCVQKLGSIVWVL